MPRRRRLRKIVAPPEFKGYKPYGTNHDANGYIELLYEEYEALKLVDYDLMNHKEASEMMGVSRATLARIYKTARGKIATAFVETKEIKAVYGNTWMEKNWYVCNNCSTRFTIPVTLNEQNCPICLSVNIASMENTYKTLD
jgi:uncharacterized protein